jgi:hypothetical protein
MPEMVMATVPNDTYAMDIKLDDGLPQTESFLRMELPGFALAETPIGVPIS